MTNKSKTLGIYAWPPHIQAEGINAVLDNLEMIGATSVSTTPYVAEPVAEASISHDRAEGSTGRRREPPADGDRGHGREIDRPLWGRKSLYIRTGSSFEHDPALFEGQKYAPLVANELTAKSGHIINDFLDEAKKRGLKTYLQAHTSHLPPLREGLDESEQIADTPQLPNGGVPSDGMVNFASLASPDIRDFFTAEITDILRNYPQADGLLLDRMEQSFYTFDDAFVDFSQHARNAADTLGFDFESMSAAVAEVIQSFGSLTNDDLDSIDQRLDIPIAFDSQLRNSNPLHSAMEFRSAITSRFLGNLRKAADNVRPGVELIPITFPPPLSTLTGADFSSYSKHADAVMIKFFTMHWPLIVTFWTEGITSLNPQLDPNKVARAVSAALEFEDEPGTRLTDFEYPEPETPHRAGTIAQTRKIEIATEKAAGMPILPSVHGYGPLEDVERRWRIGWEVGKSGMWVNRYGYLSDAKLQVLKRVVSN